MSADAALAYADEVVRRLRGVLGDDLLGAYLIGSLALGGYEPGRSDVDLAAVTAGRLRAGEADAIVAACRHESLPCPARKLELVVYARERAPAFELNLNTGAAEPLHAGVDPAAEPSFWFVLDLAIARVAGVALLGPQAAELVAEPSRAAVVAAARASLEWFLASDAPPDDLVLNACRTRRFLDDGVWSSKVDAGGWALDRLPEREVVRAALALRRGEAGAELSRAAARAFAAAHAVPSGDAPS